MKKITVVTGHYGSGKTNFSVNLALLLASQGKKVTVVDLDIVNPYFRTADFKTLFEENNISLVAPEYANSNLDIPALSFDIEQLAKTDDYLVIDVGGDDVGATALGRYANSLQKYQDNLEMVYVVNAYRYLTRTAEEASELMYEIETSARMKHTAIINNSNLGVETTLEIVEKSQDFASEISEKTGLPLMLTTCPEEFAELCEIEDTLPIKIFVKPLWDK